MELEGALITKLAVQSGKSARGDWAKQEFVIEYQDGNFPNKVCFNVWGADKVKELGSFRLGEKIHVSFNISSREYNGKWYTDLRAWRITSSAAAGGQAYGPALAPSEPLPSPAPALTADDMPGDDLPF